jgi:hypothetical protein
MIKGDIEPIGHHSPRPRIDINHPGRRLVISKKEVLDNLVREPDPMLYDWDCFGGNWVLKKEYR